jgi:hypothetical protein
MRPNCHVAWHGGFIDRIAFGLSRNVSGVAGLLRILWYYYFSGMTYGEKMATTVY